MRISKIKYKMEEDQEKRMEFINEKIIEAGIDLEAITNFAQSKGKSFDTLNIEELGVLIEQFNNKDKPQETQVKEEPKQEEIKTEEKKEEPPKQEEPPKKDEPPKQEEPPKKDEQPKQEEPPKQEEQPKQEQEQPKQEDNKEQKQEAPKENDAPAENAPPKELPKTNIHKGLYFPEQYEFKTMTQQNNKLLELVKNKTPINIQISEPKKEIEGTFFTKPIYSYRVQCTELNSDVRRTFADFEWLRNQLNKRYPLRLVPVVVKDTIIKQIGKNLKNENDENYELRKVRFLNKFIESLLKKKILCTSPIFYEFLVLDDQKLAKYKTILEKKPYDLEVGLNNLITIKGNVKCQMERDTVNDTEYLYAKTFSMSEIYNKIIINLDNVVIDFNNLFTHLRNISSLFKNLTQNLEQYKYSNKDEMKECFNNFKDTFEKWSVNVYDQCLFFNGNIKENLSYMSAELSDINTSFKRYRDYRYEYEEFTAMIKKEKENLVQAHINLELKKEENKDKKPSDIKYNEKAMDEIFYNKNMLLIEEKKRLTATMHYMLKDYDKILNTQIKKLKEINESSKKAVVIDFIKG